MVALPIHTIHADLLGLYIMSAAADIIMQTNYYVISCYSW
jgi:hypothetical protein